MNNRIRWSFISGGVAASLALAGCGGSGRAGGQGGYPGAGGPSGPGAPGASAAGPAAPQPPTDPAVEKLRAKYPGTVALVKSVMSVGALIRNRKFPFTANQASLLVAQLKPLADLQTLPQDDALKLSKNIEGSFTPDQQESLGAIHRAPTGGPGGPGGGRFGGGRGGPGGGPPGAGGGGGRGPGGGPPGGGGARFGGAGFGGPGAGGPRGRGRRRGAGGMDFTTRWISDQMAPDTNIFAEGRPHDMLLRIIGELQSQY